MHPAGKPTLWGGVSPWCGNMAPMARYLHRIRTELQYLVFEFLVCGCSRCSTHISLIMKLLKLRVFPFKAHNNSSPSRKNNKIANANCSVDLFSIKRLDKWMSVILPSETKEAPASKGSWGSKVMPGVMGHPSTGQASFLGGPRSCILKPTKVTFCLGWNRHQAHGHCIKN